MRQPLFSPLETFPFYEVGTEFGADWDGISFFSGQLGDDVDGGIAQASQFVVQAGNGRRGTLGQNGVIAADDGNVFSMAQGGTLGRNGKDVF